MKRLLAVFGLIAVLFASGCLEPPSGMAPEPPDAVTECTALCWAARGASRDLSSGPCLSDDNPEWIVEGWVCDVAHSPREAVDNQQENQCEEFRSGAASHFVEVSPDCEFIKEA